MAGNVRGALGLAEGAALSAPESSPGGGIVPGRRRPPDRRRSETRRIRWASPLVTNAPRKPIHVTVGYDAGTGRPIEIFYAAGYRSGSENETLVSDVCIVLSHMLQRDNMPDPAELLQALARERDPATGEERCASLVGMLLDELRRPPERWDDDEATKSVSSVPAIGEAPQ